MSAKIYAQRDHMAQGDYYVRHVSAMTVEALHAKSAVAAELAHRDIEIDRLATAVERDTALLQQALEALERARNYDPTIARTITALRERLGVKP